MLSLKRRKERRKGNKRKGKEEKKKKERKGTEKRKEEGKVKKEINSSRQKHKNACGAHPCIFTYFCVFL